MSDLVWTRIDSCCSLPNKTLQRDEMKIFLCAIVGASFLLGACGSSDSNDDPPATTEVEIPIETPEEEVTETPVVVEPTPTAEIVIPTPAPLIHTCLLYTSDAADE